MLNFTSDEETDRLLSARAAASVPLPPEIAFSDPRSARYLFRRRAYYGMMGVSDHPLLRFLEGFEIERNMACEVSRARYLDRLSHLTAWLGSSDPVETFAVDGKTERRVGDSTSPGTTPVPHGRRQAALNKGRAGAGAHAQARRPSFRGVAVGGAASEEDVAEDDSTECFEEP